MTNEEARAYLEQLTPEELEEVDSLIAADIEQVKWRPLDGPQRMAYESLADVIGYGGAAGGGKTDLAVGKAITQHQKVLVLRREATQLTGIIDRFFEVLGSRDGYNGADRILRLGKQQIEFGSTKDPDDWNKYQGRPHDLLIFDEAANFLASQVRALLGWLRSVDAGQRCQALLTFNPPTTAEGRWIIEFFAPWLDKKHPNPAKPGELRYFAVVDGRDVERETKDPFTHKGELITPMSRTFVPSRVTDNPYLYGTGYMTTLQSLPEPLRSQMLNGDFAAGMEDDAMQLIPTAWVEAAQARWVDMHPKPPMSSVGVDVARGGKDNTLIARRHGMWFDKLVPYPGSDTPDGPTVAGLAIAHVRDGAAIHIDVIGVGASPYDYLNSNRQHVIGVNVSEKPTALDRSGRLRFKNLRSQLWWQLREALEPEANTGIMLPPDAQILADLTAPKWKVQAACIQVESREEIHKRIGRSPDWGSAIILALMDTPPLDLLRRHANSGSHNPLAGVQGNSLGQYDPLANI